MAHARHKFFELQEHRQSQIAVEVLERIAALYAVEGRAELKAEPRQTLRESRAKPLLNDLKAWPLACRGKIPCGASIAKGGDYNVMPTSTAIGHIRYRHQACRTHTRAAKRDT